MEWRAYYEQRKLAADKALGLVKSGDRVFFSPGGEPNTLAYALAARRGQVHDVEIVIGVPYTDFGWYDQGWEDSFKVTAGFVTEIARPMFEERRGDFSIGVIGAVGFSGIEGPEQRVDVLLVEVSPPDAHGFCSFGHARWNKKELVREAKTVIAEVNPRCIRTFGDNFVHVSEIDYFVDADKPEVREIRQQVQPEEHVKVIGQYVSTLIKDGDTIEVGAGTASEPLVLAGTFDSKHDLGFHAERNVRGIVKLVREGVITGKRKTLHPGKAVASSFASTADEIAYVDKNPRFELYSTDYVNHVAVIAAHDNMVAINNALAIDLGGQVTAESIGPKPWSGAGGQLAFALGARFSKGGRSITVIPSTANTKQGKVSRIVPTLVEGTAVTVPRTVTDYVVSEYGIACLRGKTIRQRALELVSIAHPDFRAELKKAATRLYWP